MFHTPFDSSFKFCPKALYKAKWEIQDNLQCARSRSRTVLWILRRNVHNTCAWKQKGKQRVLTLLFLFPNIHMCVQGNIQQSLKILVTSWLVYNMELSIIFYSLDTLKTFYSFARICDTHISSNSLKWISHTDLCTYDDSRGTQVSCPCPCGQRDPCSCAS